MSMTGVNATSPATVIILARAGSQGLVGKNRRPIAGKPCAAWTIDYALASRRVGLVSLSTDDDELLKLGKHMGIVCVERPGELATSTATVDDAARDALQRLERFDLDGIENARAAACCSRRAIADDRAPIVILYANVPVRPLPAGSLIDRAVELFMSTGCDSVQSYAPVGKVHPYWMARVDAQTGDVRPWQGDVLNHGVYRRQDLPPCYMPDGGIIVCSRRALRREIDGVEPGPHAFFGRDRRGVINDEGAVIDIDTEVDARMAEAVLAR